MTFATLIHQWLAHRRLDAPRGAKVLGVTDQTVRNWRRGRSLPTRVRVPDLALRMNIPQKTLALAIAASLSEVP